MKPIVPAALLLAGLAPMAEAAGDLRRFDPAGLAAVVDRVGAELLPAAMVVLDTPDGAFRHGYGATTLGGATPPESDTQFRIASNTKTMTAATILLLAQAGRLDLADPISAHVDGVPNGDAVSLEMLLQMRSGFYNYTNAPELADSLAADPARAWTPAELLALAFAQPANFAPGAEFEYSNTNYLLLGLVIEKVEGKPLAEAFAERLYRPLGMAHTLLPPPDSSEIPAPYARGYIYGGPSYALVDAPYPPELQVEARAGRLRPEDVTDENPSYAQGAGGAISTADDLVTWMRALVGGGLLDADWQDRWRASLRPQDPAAPDGQKYGYGISEIAWGPNRMYFHGGEMPGYQSFMGHDPANDVTLIVWTTLTVSLDGQPTANALMLEMLDAIYVASPRG